MAGATMDLTIAQAMLKDRPVDPDMIEILRERAAGEGVRGIGGVRNALQLQRNPEYQSIVDSLRQTGRPARTLNAGGPAEQEFLRRMLERRRAAALHQAQEVGTARDAANLGIPEPSVQPLTIKGVFSS